MTSLAQLATYITTVPSKVLVTAELVRIAGAAVRDPNLSPERRKWATGVLQDPEAATSPLVMNVLLTNPTIAPTLATGDVPPDGDIEYVLAAEILPMIAPA